MPRHSEYLQPPKEATEVEETTAVTTEVVITEEAIATADTIIYIERESS